MRRQKPPSNWKINMPMVEAGKPQVDRKINMLIWKWENP
jgi:hypothetical protein